MLSHIRFDSLCFVGLITMMIYLIDASTVQAEQEDDPLRVLQQEFTAKIQPIINSQCIDCHSGDFSGGGLDLSGYQEIGQILKDRRRWKKVEHRVAAKEMPPLDDWGPLSDQDYRAIMDWLDRLLNTADCSDINPGRVTLRRLNRIEYMNTIRDLTGVEYPKALEFPGDDVGYGFDNIADVISLPPILMDRYLKAAEEIAEQIVFDSFKPQLAVSIPFTSFAEVKGSRADYSSLLMFINTTTKAPIELPETGKYRVIVDAIPEQAGKEPVRLAAAFSGGNRVERKLTQPTDELESIKYVLNGRKGKREIEISFTNDYYQEASGDQPAEDRNVHLVSVTIEGPIKSAKAIQAANQSLIQAEIPVDPEEQLKMARQILYRFGSKAYRREMTRAELSRVLSFFKQAQTEGDNFESALKFSVEAILVSPTFLFRVEEPTPPEQTRKLNDYELASSLSYFLWSSMPDNELFVLAHRGKLSDPKIYRQQVLRMLRDPKASALIDNFVAQWLQLAKLQGLEPDPTLFPGVDNQIRNDMIEETKLVVADLIRNDASILSLLETDFTYLTPRLADFYGIEAIFDNPSADQFSRVSTRSTPRIGLLTHGSILMVTSNPDRTSPVKRGKWVMENLLGDEPPPADPSAMPIEDQPELVGTLRQRLEQHRADPGCAACHKVMDELGFALENFDAVGRWRDMDEGHPVDASGLLPDGSSFSGAIEMQQTIKNQMKEDFVRCVTEKLMIYATGRGMEYFDDCALDKITKELEKNNFRFSELIVLVATSDPFTQRRGNKEEFEELLGGTK